MTQADKNSYLRMFRKFQASREEYYRPKFQKALQNQVEQYLHHNDLSSIDFHPMFNLLVDLYKDVTRVFGHKVHLSIRRQQAKSRQPIGFSDRVYQILKEKYGIDLLKDAMDITQTTRDQIQAILTDIANRGGSVNEIADKIQALDFTAVRARRIARTETVGAANIAGDIVARDSGLAMNKEWLAVLDSRTRFDHMQIHGTIIDINSKFEVAGNAMRFPGDRGEGGDIVEAGEVVNCRCVCLYIPKIDSRGLAMAA